MTATSKAPKPEMTSAKLRKREPAEQAAFLNRMIRSTARRCAEEDPENGLAMLLQVQALLADLVDDTAVTLIENVGGKLVGGGVGMSKQGVNKRWGPSSTARARVQERRTAARAAGWAKAHTAISKALAAAK